MSAATVPYAGVTYCACGTAIVRTSKFGPKPKQCAECRAAEKAKKTTKVAKTEIEQPTTPDRVWIISHPEDATEETAPPPSVDALQIIATLGLDYCVGSAVRFLLELHDGDPLDNLKTARTYLDAAIAAREAA